jgi:hypothetical protein
MNERLPCSDVRKLPLLARKKIQRHKRLLSETDQLLRDSRAAPKSSYGKISSRILSCRREKGLAPATEKRPAR